jgi:hypothetical protein
MAQVRFFEGFDGERFQHRPSEYMSAGQTASIWHLGSQP